MGGDRAAQGRPLPWRPRLPARSAYALHAVLRVNGVYRRLAEAVERHPRAERWFTAGEQVVRSGSSGARCAVSARCPRLAMRAR